MSQAALARAAAPFVWRRPRHIARKLAEFGATEAGSALDMLRAAELTTNPKLRRIFLRHALDEARHARMFRQAAQELDPAALTSLSAHALSHRRRQDLYETLGDEAFLAFVHRAERAGESHFRALIHELARVEPELARLFETVAEDERFHVNYSGHWLARLAGTRARRRLLEERTRAAWAAWRRAGRVLGERAAWWVGVALYFVVLPPFALLERRLDPERPGWKPARSLPSSIAEARRQF